MPKKIKKFYKKDPNEWMNKLHKAGIIIYPDAYQGHLRIVVRQGEKVKYGKKLYTTETINEALIDAHEYMYNQVK